ncbi:hypothetical protein WA026_003522 [Henosepilachna vigintioctopunctata]|uniref:ABC transmembrane type-1 domain-containing protein n=1 Tax=Henosepilachna vigintioctopunctata TaxID=420089 RepID=A0AAW1TMC9_9CUCU
MGFLIKASRNLHNSTFNKLITATMQFFNINPSGRILNRFSEDIGIVDEYIPLILYDVITIGLLFVFVVILASMVEFFMFPSSILLAGLFISLRAIYLRTSRNVKRIVAITRSPMYSHIAATLHGLTTIRAFNADKILISEFDYFQDRNSSAHFLFLASSQCFGFWINFFCVCFLSVATFALVIFNESELKW